MMSMQNFSPLRNAFPEFYIFLFMSIVGVCVSFQAFKWPICGGGCHAQCLKNRSEGDILC